MTAHRKDANTRSAVYIFMNHRFIFENKCAVTHLKEDTN